MLKKIIIIKDFFVLFIGIIAFLYISSVKIGAQNLIPNPGFDLHPKFGNGVVYEEAEGWHFNDTTSAYYVKCHTVNCPLHHPVSRARRPALIRTARTEPCFMELPFVLKKNRRGYLTVKLRDSLKTNELYYISMYVLLDPKSNYVIRDIPVQFSVQKKNWWGTNTSVNQGEIRNMEFINSIVRLRNPNKKWLTDTTWVMVEACFRAKGGERYLSIGNFFPNQETRLIKSGVKLQDTVVWYSIDDLSLEQKKDCYLDASTFTPENIGYDNPLVLENVEFELNKYSLLMISFIELNKLLDLMNNYPGIKVDINGHTDNTGDYNSNMELSKRRAETIVQYLISNDIEPSRLRAFGFGDTKPIESNDTEEGRARNRRVEFVLRK